LLHPREEVVKAALGASNGRRQPQDPSALDDFAAAGISRIEDIRDRFVPNFYFGAEADDPSVKFALDSSVNPLNVRLNAFWASDAGHWDVVDYSDALAQTWDLVERGTLSVRDFRDLVFTHPYNLYAGANPEFFKNTAVEAQLAPLAVAAE
jgi:hypothetical protein